MFLNLVTDKSLLSYQSFFNIANCFPGLGYGRPVGQDPVTMIAVYTTFIFTHCQSCPCRCHQMCAWIVKMKDKVFTIPGIYFSAHWKITWKLSQYKLWLFYNRFHNLVSNTHVNPPSNCYWSCDTMESFCIVQKSPSEWEWSATVCMGTWFSSSTGNKPVVWPIHKKIISL